MNLLGKERVTEHFPFDEDTCAESGGKMFVLSSANGEPKTPSLNLKCDPGRAGTESGI